MQAMKHIGHVFKESDSDASAMIVLEGDQPLGDEAHRYYAELIRRFRADTVHITHVQDFWGDPLTAAGAQSGDGKATYVQLNLAGNQGEALANDSIAAVRKIIAGTPRAGRRPRLCHRHDGADRRSAPRRRYQPEGGHGDHHGGHPGQPVHRVPLGHHGGAGAADGDPGSGGRPRFRCRTRTLRPDRVVDVLGEPADDVGHRGGHRLRNLRLGPLPRGPQRPARTARPRSTRCIAARRTSSSVRA